MTVLRPHHALNPQASAQRSLKNIIVIISNQSSILIIIVIIINHPHP